VPAKEKPYRKLEAWRSYCKLSIHNDRTRYVESLKIYNQISESLAIDFRKANCCIYKRVFGVWRGICYSRRHNKHLIETGHARLKNVKQIMEKDLNTLKKTQGRCLNISIQERKLEFRKETLSNCIREWRAACPTPLRKPKEPINVSHDPYRVVVKINVNENGHAEVKMSAPLEHIYDTYFKKLRKPPVDEYIVALREFGYPEWVLDKMKAKSLLSPQTEPERSVLKALLEEVNKKKPKPKVVSKLTKLTRQ